MLSIALATLAYGRLADRFSRRPVLLTGMMLLLGGSALCAMVPGIEWLIAGRIVQAAGGASGIVVTRAIVLDSYGRERAGQVMAGLLAAMMIAQMLATPLSGVLNDHRGWHANFLATGAAAGGVRLLAAWLLPETRRVDWVPSAAGLLATTGGSSARTTFAALPCRASSPWPRSPRPRPTRLRARWGSAPRTWA